MNLLLGPLPQGEYTIGKQGDITTNRGRGTFLSNAMRLTPNPGNQMFDRSGFIIHGDNRRMDNTASDGCIIMGPSIRNQIGNSGDNILRVVL